MKRTQWRTVVADTLYVGLTSQIFPACSESRAILSNQGRSIYSQCSTRIMHRLWPHLTLEMEFRAYAKILSGPEFVSFSSDRDKGLSKRQSACDTRSRCSRCRSGLGLRFLSLSVLLTTVF